MKGSPLLSFVMNQPLPANTPDPQQHHATDTSAVRCIIYTVSDTRTLTTDEGGPVIAQVLEDFGHTIVDRQIIPDELETIRGTVLTTVENGIVDVVIVTGGTGLGPRDVTPEALLPLFSRMLPGFGETFRHLSFEQVGSKALLSRADAGVIARTLVFMLPGSPRACRLAMEKLITPILGHAVGLLRTRA